MALELTSHAVRTGAGTRHVLVVTPTGSIEAGREKLEQLRDSLATSTVDLEIVEHLQDKGFGAYEAFVFRGRSEDDRGSWRFAPDLDESEINELSYLMFRAQLELNRLCAAVGMFDNLYIEFGAEELAAFARATSRMASEIREQRPNYVRGESPEDRLARLDLWIVERHTFYSAMPLEVLLERILPPRLGRLDGRRNELRSMLEGLPPGSIPL